MPSIQEFLPLTEQAVTQLLENRYGYTDKEVGDSRRRKPRWPFPGTIEVWVPVDDGEEHLLGRGVNLSPNGVGAILDVALKPMQSVPIAIHEPEATLYGRAEVRHCAPHEEGYFVGLQFVFD